MENDERSDRKDEQPDRRQVCLSKQGRDALEEGLRKHFPRYPAGCRPEQLANVVKVDPRTLAKMLTPDARVRQASVEQVFADVGVVFDEELHLDLAYAADPISSSMPQRRSGPQAEEALLPGGKLARTETSDSGSQHPVANIPRKSRIGIVVGLAIALAITGVQVLIHYVPGLHRSSHSTGTAQPPTPSDTQSEVLLYDSFTVDPSLNSSLWTINGTVAQAALADFEDSPVSITAPQITFDKENGLGISGVDAAGQQGGIQSVQSFTPPFTATVLCNVTSLHSDVLRLAISDASAEHGASLGILGGAPGAAGGSGFIFATSQGKGRTWKQVGEPLSPLPPADDIWYVLAIAVDPSGKATVAVSSGDITIGKATADIGRGPFYVILAQGTQPQSPAGQNQAYCGVIQVIGRAEE